MGWVVGVPVVGEALGCPLATVGLEVVGALVGMAVGDSVGKLVGSLVGEVVGSSVKGWGAPVG